MSVLACRILAVTLLFCQGLVFAAEPKPPTPEEIAQWIKQLGDDEFAVREKASELLWKAGRAAEAALEKVVKSGDPEVVRRARDLLDKFRWGIYPDTPKEIVERILRYQSGDRNAKAEVVKQLFERGGPGCAALVKIAAAEVDPALRRDLFTQISLEAARLLPTLLVEGSHDTLEALLEMGLANGLDAAVQNYVAYWLLRGRLDERIAQFKERKGAWAGVVLAFLYRASGDLKSALAAAEKAQRADLVDGILFDQGDWKALAKRPDQPNAFDLIVPLGWKAAYHRLAGNADSFDKVAGELRRRGGDPSLDEISVWLCAKALLLNERPEAVLGLPLRGKNAAVAFDVLCAQLKYRDAFALADQLQALPAADRFDLGLSKARALAVLGKKEDSQKTFASLFEEAKDLRKDLALANLDRVRALIEAEARAGLRAQASEHAASLLAGLAREKEEPNPLLGPVTPRHILSALFPARTDADVWWRWFQRQHPADKPAATLRRVREVLERKLPVKELEDQLTEVLRAEPFVEPPEWERTLAAFGEAALLAGLEGLGRGCLERAAKVSGAPWILVRLGDLHAERQQWQEAGGYYQRAWEKNKAEPLPLYLRGWALAQAGSKEEGQKLMDRAGWLPLGNEAVRYQLATDLARRGHTAAARRQRELLQQVSRPGSYYAGEALRQLGFDALDQKDYLKAADYHERAMLRCLQPEVSFVEHAAWVGVPYQVHRQRALGLLLAGRTDEAVKEIKLCQVLMPGVVDLPITLMPELEQRDRQKEADALFAGAFEAHEKWCADYPQCALAHNNLAWLAACCRRQLDKALEHARKAVELAPGHAGHLDTLAEVHFQRGDKDKAIELMKKCIEVEPKNNYFKKQLKRFEAGDPKAAIPDAYGTP
jgi:tetratricopeptide (TPR) repeat protein